jgi:hypothetical protein
MSRSPVPKKIRKLLMRQLRNDVPQRITMGNTCLGWSRILKLFLKRGKEEEVKRQRRRERMQRRMRRIIVTKLQDCLKKDQYFGTYHIERT